jgi:ribose/xylose/arabinose/galactoside ABC-type transport system permease subunit
MTTPSTVSSLPLAESASASAPAVAPAALRLPRVDRKYLPLLTTISLLFAMVTAGALRYDGFFSAQVGLNLFIDNAFLIVAAVGMTFVILTGGIDLSVGSVIALTTMVSASLVEHHGWCWWAARVSGPSWVC